MKEKKPLEECGRIKDSITKVTNELKGVGRVLVRYSGTEPICRVMVEGPKLKPVQDLANEIASVIEEELGLKGKREV